MVLRWLSDTFDDIEVNDSRLLESTKSQPE